MELVLAARADRNRTTNLELNAILNRIPTVTCVKGTLEHHGGKLRVRVLEREIGMPARIKLEATDLTLEIDGRKRVFKSRADHLGQLGHGQNRRHGLRVCHLPDGTHDDLGRQLTLLVLSAMNAD